MKQTARVIGFILGGGILIYQAVKGISFLLDSKIVPSFGWLLFSLLFGVLAIAVQILCWTLIMRDLGASISFRQAMTGYVLNFLPRYIPGTLWGYLSRAEWLKNQYGVEYSASHWGSIVEMFVGIYSSIFLVCIFFAKEFSLTYRLLVMVGLFFSFIFLWIVLNTIASTPQIFKIANPMYGLNIRLQILFIISILLIMNWFNYGLIVYGSINAIFKSTTELNFSGWIQYSGLFSGSWLIGFLSWFFPAGLGPRDWVLSQGLILWNSIPNDGAYLIAVIARLLGILSEIIWTLINFMSQRKKINLFFGGNISTQ